MATANWATKMLDDLPGEVVEKILCMLPVKEVIRATTLKKSLCSLIHSKSFVSLYNNETLISENPNPPLIFIRFVDRSGSVRCSLRRDNGRLDEFMRVRFPLGADCKEVGFCNSLVCLFDCRGKQLILWNPLLQKTLTLPKSIHYLDLNCFFGLGFVHETSDYKVLVIDQNRRAQLYSLQLNCWTVVSGSPLCDGVVHPGCVRSSLYWVSAKDESGRSVVVAFDLKSQAFGEISLPDGWESIANLYVRAFGDSGIAVVGDSEDLGVPPSDACIIQVMDVNEKRWKFHSGAYAPRSGKMWVMGFSKEGRAIIDRGRYLTIALRGLSRLRDKIKQGQSGDRFEILCLSGSYLVAEDGGPRNRTGGVSASLSSPDGQEVGGAIATLIAAAPIQVYGAAKVKDRPVGRPKLNRDNAPQPSSDSKPVAPVKSGFTGHQNFGPTTMNVWPLQQRNPHADIDLTRG